MERLWSLVSPAPEGLLGLYYPDPEISLPVIVLDRGLSARPRPLRCVLAEELGHHFTIPRASVLKPYFSFADAVMWGKDELRAMRWATGQLIPDEVLREVLPRIGGLAELARVMVVKPVV